MSTTLIKLNGSSGDLKEMTTAEEAYIAYHVSAYLASSSWNNTDIGTIINSTDTAERAVGAFTNTYYNQAVGTHPGSSLSTGSTTTTLKQNNGSRSEIGLNYPISWETGGSEGIHQMSSADLDAVCDRILAYIMTNEWPGSLRLATSTPANYSLFRSGVFSDTRADGTNTVYNLYKRTSMPTAPATVRPVRLNGTSGDLKEMTDSEIQLTFGQRVINRMISADDRTGRYFFGTSAPTSNGYTGTWVSRSPSIVDSRNTTSEVAYSQIYSANYQRIRIANSTTAFAGNYTTAFSGNYTRISTRTSIRISYLYGYRYVGNFAGNFTGDFVGNYIHDYIGDYTHDYTGNYLGDYVGNYLGNYVGTTLSSSSTTINTYTLYVRTA